MTHICVGKLINIGSDNGLSPGRRQAIIWTNAGILLIRPLGTNFSEFIIVIHTFSFNKMHLKMSSAKWRPFCLGLNVIFFVQNKTLGLSGSKGFHRNWPQDGHGKWAPWDHLIRSVGLDPEVGKTLKMKRGKSTQQTWIFQVNPSDAEARLFQEDYVYIVVADALAPCITRPSADVVLTMTDK